MAKITINRENFNVDERELEQGSFSIGRNHDNALSIDDPAVSNHHAQIVTVFDSSYVEDLGSTNGTFVNGKQVNTHTLHNGDVLTLGHYQILFQNETTTAAQSTNATMMIGVSQLEKLTKKTRQKNPIKVAGRKSPPAASSHNPLHTPAATPAPPADKPKLKVHENNGQPTPDNNELPDISDDVDILGPTQSVPSTPHRIYNRRKSDTSLLPSLKVIALAVLATVITFTLLTLIFK